MPRVLTAKQVLNEDPTGNSAVDMFVEEIEWHIEHDEAERSFSNLLDWAYPDERKLTYEEAVHLALKALSFEECHRILRKAGKRSRGRVATQRIPAIKALVYHEYLKWTWAKVATKFCACDKKTHDTDCGASLRSQVVRLKKLLREYGVSF
jgi:hypothetical protein